MVRRAIVYTPIFAFLRHIHDYRSLAHFVAAAVSLRPKFKQNAIIYTKALSYVMFMR